MGPTLMAAAGQNWYHQWAGTHLSLSGLYWFGLINVLMLVVFLTAAARRERPSRRREDGPPVSRTSLETAAMLASDAERQGAGDVIARAIADGRLSIEEGLSRIDGVYESRHRGQLARLIEDLPPAATRKDSKRPGWAHVAHAPGYPLYGVAALGVLAAVMVQALTGLWELWPVALAAMAPMGLVRHH